MISQLIHDPLEQECLPLEVSLAPPISRGPFHGALPTSSSLEYYHNSADQGRVFRKCLETLASLAAIMMGLQFILLQGKILEYAFLPALYLISLPMWGASLLGLGIIRITVLIVNGWWPYTAVVRKWLAVAFLGAVWLPLLTSYIWNAWESLANHNSPMLVGLPFSVLCVCIEFLVFYAHASFLLIEKRRKQEDGGS